MEWAVGHSRVISAKYIRITYTLTRIYNYKVFSDSMAQKGYKMDLP